MGVDLVLCDDTTPSVTKIYLVSAMPQLNFIKPNC